MIETEFVCSCFNIKKGDTNFVRKSRFTLSNKYTDTGDFYDNKSDPETLNLFRTLFIVISFCRSIKYQK